MKILNIPVSAGPDICGYSTKRVHVIFNYKGQNHLITKDIKCKVYICNYCISILSNILDLFLILCGAPT